LRVEDEAPNAFPLNTQLSTINSFQPPDERTQIGILTSGLNLAPAFPIQCDQWLWEFVARYSGATVPDFHGVP